MTTYSKIYIETSALDQILDDSSVFQEFISIGARVDARCYISAYTFDELLSDPNVQRIKNRFQKLNQLQICFGPNKLSFARSWDHVFNMELSKQLISIPTISSKYRKWLESLIRDQKKLETFLQSSKTYFAKVKNAKEVFLKADQDLAKHQVEIITLDSQKIDFIANYNGPAESFWLIEKLLSASWITSYVPRTKDLVENRERYPAIFASLAFADCSIIGMTIDRTNGHPLAFAFRSEFGNWFDWHLAAPAVYCDLFISNDSRLRLKNEHLRKRKCLSFRSISLEEFLAQYK